MSDWVDICIQYLHSFHSHSLVYPPGLESLYPMFRVCATERLFIPDMFPAMDRAIYIDTDLMFLRYYNSSKICEFQRFGLLAL